MSRRIDVELTSERQDGTWTWRAAGAREPKGSLDGGLLHPGAKVGDVVRVDADFDIDGITVTAVMPPKQKREDVERIEVIGPPPREAPPPRPRREERGSAEDGDGRRERRRPPRGDRPGHADGRGTGERRPRGDRPARQERPARAPRPRPPAPPAKPKPKKLRPGRTHRDAVLASLSPEERPVAEQVLKGGIPAVRQALDEQNATLRQAGQPEVKSDAIVALAERLLPGLRVADWRDRAEAALADVDEISLRDLRSVVVSADDPAVARDEGTRDPAGRLRAALERRTGEAEQEWLSDIGWSLEVGRVVRALRVSSRPPQPGTRLPDELAGRLAQAASAALGADVPADRWATVLDAVAYSPVRRMVEPAGAPPEPSDELKAAAQKHAGRVPAVATLLGLETQPAPRPRPPRRAPRPSGGARGPAGRGAPPVPPPGPPRIPPPPPPRTAEPTGDVSAGQSEAVPAPPPPPPPPPPQPPAPDPPAGGDETQD